MLYLLVSIFILLFCDQIFDKKHLFGGGVYLGSWFESVVHHSREGMGVSLRGSAKA